MSGRGVVAGLVLVALLGGAGCSAPLRPSAHRTDGDPAPTSSARPSPTRSSGSSAASSTSATPYRPTAPADTPLGAGERVWAAFSQRTLPQGTWWTHLKPLLSDSARAVYVYDDPQNIPEMHLTGRLHLAPKPPGQPRYTAEVLVPTSKGVFGLDLERHTLKSRWLLYAIKFPRGVQ